MFRITIPDHLTLAVTAHPPDGGEGRFQISIRYLTVSGRQKLLARIQDKGLTDMQLVEELVVGWDGLCDEHGEPLRFEDARARALVLDTPFVFEPIRDAVLDEIIYRHLPAGNSAAPPADGPAAKTATSG